MQTTDPRKPLILGIIVMGILVLAGIVWAVAFAPSEQDTGRSEANLAFDDSNDPVTGNVNSNVVVRMFEDFECPACRSAAAGVNYAIKKYGDRVKFVWNDFPLMPVHQNAREAANAGRCAEEQGLFWEYADTLYDFQPNWSELSDPTQEFVNLASKDGLNVDAFTACLNARKYDDKIAKDMEEGRANSVNATPTFFIGNTRLSGALTPSAWDQALQPLLKDVAAPASSSPAADEAAGTSTAESTPAQ